MPDKLLPHKLLPPEPTDFGATLVFFLIIFGVVGAFFLFIHLVMGSVIRPNKPDAEKLTIYECGEPTIGSAWIQFDLRFYVVALLFVIFDVEVAFFFPWATVFGKANQLAEFDGPIIALQKEREAIRPRDKAATELTDDQKKKLEDIDRRMVEAQRKPKQIMKELEPSGLSVAAKQKLGLLTNTEKPVKKIDPDGAPENPANEPGKEDKKDSVARVPETPAIEPGVANRWAQVAFFDILVFFGVLMVGFAYVWRRGDIDWVRAYAHHTEPPVAPEKPLEQKISA